jgi:hypothetical protein
MNRGNPAGGDPILRHVGDLADGEVLRHGVALVVLGLVVGRDGERPSPASVENMR